MNDACAQLHVHDSRSFKDALSPTEALVQRAAELGQPGMGLTNHGHLYSAPVFFQACHRHKIKGIIGMEAYEAVPYTWDTDPAGPHHAVFKQKYDKNIPRYFHLTLWVINNAGWMNLCALHTQSFTTGFKPGNQPLIDRASLERHNEGLIVGLGCPQSRTNQALGREGFEAAVKAAGWYFEVFGDRACVEVMSGSPEQVRMLADQRRLAKHFGRQTLGTNDVHYLYQSDGVLNGPHHALVMARKFKSAATTATESGDQSDDSYGSWYGSDQYYLKSRQEMLASGIFPQEIDYGLEILDRADFTLLGPDGKPSNPPKPPTYKVPHDDEFESWLAQRAA